MFAGSPLLAVAQQPSATPSTSPSSTTAFIENRSGQVNFRVQVPQGWVLDVLEPLETSKQTVFGDNIFYRLASLCKEATSLPSIIGDKTYHCGEHGSSAAEVVHIQSYSIMNEDPLLYHMDILDDNPSITNVRAATSNDTTINYIDPQTNQTITALPAKRVDLVLTHADGTQSIESVLVTTIVFSKSENSIPLFARAESVGEHYAIGYQRPLPP